MNRALRLLVLPRYDELGASSRLRMLQYIPALQASGFDVHVASLLDDGYVTDLYSGNVSVWKVACAYFRRLRVLWSAGHYDVVWLEKELFPWLPGWFEKWLLPDGVVIVADYDDAVFHRYDQHRCGLVRRLLGRKIDQIMERADLVTAGNGYLAERATAAGARNVEWLPTVVDLDRYPGPAPKTDIRTVTIGWIGSPATAHYLHSLTAVLQELASTHVIRCVAIGAREDQLQGTLFEAWPWSESGEAQMLHQFDIGIMPLPNEPWECGKCGYKLIQYMSRGVPVVASAVGVNADIVRAGENGELAQTPGEWTQALDRLVCDATLRQRMGAAGRKSVEKTYSLQVQAMRLVDMLRNARSRNDH